MQRWVRGDRSGLEFPADPDTPVRAQLLMLSNVLHLWDTQDFGALLDEFQRR